MQHLFDRTIINAVNFTLKFGAPKLPLLQSYLRMLLQLCDWGISHRSQQKLLSCPNHGSSKPTAASKQPRALWRFVRKQKTQTHQAHSVFSASASTNTKMFICEQLQWLVQHLKSHLKSFLNQHFTSKVHHSSRVCYSYI